MPTADAARNGENARRREWPRRQEAITFASAPEYEANAAATTPRYEGGTSAAAPRWSETHRAAEREFGANRSRRGCGGLGGHSERRRAVRGGCEERRNLHEPSLGAAAERVQPGPSRSAVRCATASAHPKREAPERARCCCQIAAGNSVHSCPSVSTHHNQESSPTQS